MKVYPPNALGVVDAVISGLMESSTDFTLKDEYGIEAHWRHGSLVRHIDEFVNDHVTNNIRFRLEMPGLAMEFAPNVDGGCGCGGCVCGA